MATNVLAKRPTSSRSCVAPGSHVSISGPSRETTSSCARIAKGSDAASHVQAAELLRAAGIEQSVIFLLGAGGRERSDEHARASAELATAMDPEFLAALTLSIRPGTPLWTQYERGQFELPDTGTLMRELRCFVAEAAPSDALFRSNHISNRLVVGGRLPAGPGANAAGDRPGTGDELSRAGDCAALHTPNREPST
jgi:hypothetical protein